MGLTWLPAEAARIILGLFNQDLANSATSLGIVAVNRPTCAIPRTRSHKKSILTSVPAKQARIQRNNINLIVSLVLIPNP